MNYRIDLTPAAERDLRKLPREVLRRVDPHILALAEDPHYLRAICPCPDCRE